MRRVKLYTREGGFVVSGWLPPFLPGLEADVVLWGSRCFAIRREAGTPVRDGERSLFYDEIFAVALATDAAVGAGS